MMCRNRHRGRHAHCHHMGDKSITPLSSCRGRHPLIIESIGCEPCDMDRLASMGLHEGSLIRVMGGSGGGPLLVESGHGRIALGRCFADCILCKEA